MNPTDEQYGYLIDTIKRLPETGADLGTLLALGFGCFAIGMILALALAGPYVEPED